MKTIQDVKTFFKQLYDAGKMYHPEDDAHSIISGSRNDKVFSYEEAEEMNKKMELATSICNENNVDICELALDLIIKSNTHV